MLSTLGATVLLAHFRAKVMMMWVPSAIVHEKRGVLEEDRADDGPLDSRWGFMSGRKQVSTARLGLSLILRAEIHGLCFVISLRTRVVVASGCVKLKTGVALQ